MKLPVRSAAFDSPSRIVVDRAGRIYVSDNGRPTQIFTSDGKVVGEGDGGGAA
jgi:DNA-binding transcriptional regulator/RsmH inhibitor MraZ